MGGFVKTLLETFFRFLPFPVKPGLRRFGSPKRDAPVLVTANFDLTVRRVSRVLQRKGIDCYLLVCNTRGINVWCAAEGGHFTAKEVISVIKTSGLDELVDHRRLILPQLAASGINPREIKEKTGWRCVFGPVYAEDIPSFLDSGLKKSAEMSLVKFPLRQRLEMAIMWAFPLSLLFLLPLLLWRPSLLFGAMALVWALALAMHVFYFHLPGRVGIMKALSMGTLFVVALALYSLIWHWTLRAFVSWSTATIALSALMGFDLAGNTPLERNETEALLQRVGIWRGQGRFARRFEVTVDGEKCNGCRICVSVCPRGIYEIDAGRAMVVYPGRCMNCNACYRQCPVAAISVGADFVSFYSPSEHEVRG